jgi:putative peptide zinc metalloprotease protein
VIQLLGQLHQASLLQSDLAPDSRQLFERLRRHQQAQVRGALSSVLFLRIPLWDPDRFLRSLLALARPVFSWLGVVVWAAVVLLAAKTAIDHRDALFDRGQEVLAPGNLALLFGAFFLTKLLHEFGHAFACRVFGGEVHQMGIMLLVFSPVPYVDATASWSFRERWRRVWVGAAGMYVELFIAALAVFVWANTGGGLLNSLAYNVIFVASVSTLLFNLNPLLRFDGYYILSDLADTPNLHQRSRTQMFSWAEQVLFGLPDPPRPAATRREAAFLGLFGIASGLYRIFVFTVIIPSASACSPPPWAASRSSSCPSSSSSVTSPAIRGSTVTGPAPSPSPPASSARSRPSSPSSPGRTTPTRPVSCRPGSWRGFTRPPTAT